MTRRTRGHGVEGVVAVDCRGRAEQTVAPDEAGLTVEPWRYPEVMRGEG